MLNVPGTCLKKVFCKSDVQIIEIIFQTRKTRPVSVHTDKLPCPKSTDTRRAVLQNHSVLLSTDSIPLIRIPKVLLNYQSGHELKLF